MLLTSQSSTVEVSSDSDSSLFATNNGRPEKLIDEKFWLMLIQIRKKSNREHLNRIALF